MGQVLHGSATTTEAVRWAIQTGQESVRAAARHHGISATTIQKWRGRTTTADERMGLKKHRSTVLTAEVVYVSDRHWQRSGTVSEAFPMEVLSLDNRG